MRNPTNNPIPYLLKCDHMVYFTVAPRMGDQIFCFRCDDYSFMTVMTDDWTVECSKCKYLRHFGTDNVRAERKAKEHSVNTHHATHVFFNGTYRFTAGQIVPDSHVG